ncbi:hypothetical protein ETAE_2969 [Edwardsiella piscicida]|uniref:Uncharacterized protein n=2 Tax=Edwardsiella TaxID=635 RepID=A0A0H3DTH3_EDWTF|nr:hypothetical protein ETAE_2969 [Edwardsiella tarda EIB202]ADM42801.1 hypothetical protein ETAF_2698 [Edwardsiella tarda FL6-60]AGH74978.1 hypothetical protein ETAC_14285 [Edwardsiella piscicida C07-087]
MFAIAPRAPRCGDEKERVTRGLSRDDEDGSTQCVEINSLINNTY